MDALLNTAWLLAFAREASPLVLAVLAAVLAGRAGLADYAIDGKLLLGAFVAAAAGAATGTFAAALLAAALAGLAVSLLQGLVCMARASDVAVTGIGLGLVIAGAAGLMAQARWWPGGALPLWPAAGAAWGWALWLVMPVLLGVAVAVVLQHTRSGLRLRAAGAEPSLAEAAGLPVLRIRLGAMAANGLLSGAGGALLLMAAAGAFSPSMTAGRGLLALAAAMAARSHPLGALALALVLAGLLAAGRPEFALAWAAAGQEQAWPSKWLQAMPFVAALAVLTVWRAKPDARS